MATIKREKISAVDTAWLRMDRPSNLMMICGVLIFRERLSFGRLKRIVAERFLVFERFRQRPVETAAASYWETDGAFDLDEHVVRSTLPAGAGKVELEALVSQLIATALPPERPRWQFHLVEDYAGASALIIRIHHCYADGIALVRVMLSMTDATADGPPAMPFEARPRRARNEVDADDPLGQLLAPVTDVLSTARKLGAKLVEKGAEVWNEPTKAVELAGKGTAFTNEIAKLAMMGSDSSTSLKGQPGVDKRVAWADPLPLEEVKVIGRALGASVNDVLLSCVAGALRGYFVDQGEPTENVMMRALVPVNLRPLEKAWQLGNQFGLVFLELPIGIENPIERLYAVRANMRALKDSYQPILALGLLAAMGSGPRVLQEALLAVLARNASAVMTNVPGPQAALYLAGAKIDAIMFWVPQSGDIGLGVSIISFNGAVQFGIVTDRGLCPHPERIIARFGTEFEKLLLTTLLSPWPREAELDPNEAAMAVGITG
jgi:diacylglycerol O-acyltransferase / wax synthase